MITVVKKVLALAAALLVALVGVAHAEDYPTPGHIMVVVEGTLVPGGPITVDAQLFEEGASVSFTINGETVTIPLGAASANSSGVVRLAGLIPAGTAPGAYTLSAVGAGADGEPATITLPIRITALSAGPATVAGITVERPARSSGSALPLSETGSSNTRPLTEIAVAVIAAGGLLLLLADRRRSTASSPTS